MHLSRRQFAARLLRASSATLAAPALVPRRATADAASAPAPAVVAGPNGRPRLDFGVASGDVTSHSAVIWSRTDRPARMIVEWADNEAFRDRRRVVGPVTGPEADFTARTLLRRLPAGRRLFYRVRFEDRNGGRDANASEPGVGELRTAATRPADVFFAWSGDTCGQGYGIDPAHGGFLTYESIRRLRPEFLVHSGDLIYADNPLSAEQRLPDGGVWRNLLTDEKRKVAETLAEFRDNYRYNLRDHHVRACQAEVPVFAQWDDHEVRNNWYPGEKLLADDRYTEKDVDVLVPRARQAFFEYAPVRATAARRIYRHVPRGPLCDLFFLDLRSYRSPNNTNRQPRTGPDAALLGEPQLAWLESALRASKARWKVICSDMPLGLLIGDAAHGWEAVSNGDAGAPLGRELEIARLLRSLQKHRVRNLVWLTADVHYAAAHYYDPAQAAFGEFDPFWEFVSGPLHAGTFGPGAFDRTFGPTLRWSARPPGAPQNLPPSANEQFFGTVHIDARTGVATVAQHNRVGTRLWSIDLEPV
jgi:alkaline phosphatase D